MTNREDPFTADWEKGFKKWKEKKRTKPYIDSIKREVISGENEIKTGIHKDLRDFKLILRTPKARRIEKYVVILVYVIALGILAYLIMSSFFSNYLPFNSNSFTIKAEDSQLFDSLRSFYIDNNVLGDKLEINGEIVRPINSARPFNFVFVPKTNIKSKNAALTLNLYLNGTGSNIYLNNQLIFPSLENYELIEENDEDYIYVRKDTLYYINISNFTKTLKIEEFIYKNFPGESVWSSRKLEPVSIQIEDYKQEDTLINTTFRDNLRLVVYAKGNLNINFTKQDLNGYVGQDEYNVEITNQAGDIVFSQIYEDDGDKLDSGRLGVGQDFNINLNVQDGVYYIYFTKDVYNQYADSTIKNIKINSNKVLIMGNFLPIEPFSFYTKISSQKNIKFNYWHNGKDQIIKVSGLRDEIINLSKEWISKNYEYNLSRGDYSFELEKGYLQIYNDFSSPSKENWFDIPLNSKDKFDNQNILIISKDNFEYDIGKLVLKKEVVLNDKITKIKILDANRVYFESAKLEAN